MREDIGVGSSIALCFAKERKVWIKYGRSEKRDKLFEKTTAIYTIFNLVILVNKNDLPLFARIHLMINNLVDCIFKQKLASHLNLFSIITVGVLRLHILAKNSEKLRSNFEVVDPRNITNKIFSYDIRDLI